MMLLGLDTETTGLPTNSGVGPQPNILTLYMAVIDSDFEIREELDLKLKPIPDEFGRSLYCVQTEALGINGIDLIKHDKEALNYKDAKPIVYSWLKSAYEKYGDFLVPFGNGVGQDIGWITDCVISKSSWQQYVSRNVIELHSLAQTLKLMGKIPETQSLSLGKIAAYFGITVDELRLHEASYDVRVGTAVLQHLTDLMKSEAN